MCPGKLSLSPAESVRIISVGQARDSHFPLVVNNLGKATRLIPDQRHRRKSQVSWKNMGLLAEKGHIYVCGHPTELGRICAPRLVWLLRGMTAHTHQEGMKSLLLP